MGSSLSYRRKGQSQSFWRDYGETLHIKPTKAAQKRVMDAIREWKASELKTTMATFPHIEGPNPWVALDENGKIVGEAERLKDLVAKVGNKYLFTRKHLAPHEPK